MAPVNMPSKRITHEAGVEAVGREPLFFFLSFFFSCFLSCFLSLYMSHSASNALFLSGFALKAIRNAGPLIDPS